MGCIPLRTTRVGTYDHYILHVQIRPYPSQRTGFRVQIIDRYVEEPLYLTRMQVHSDDMITARRLQHICHQFCCDGRSGFILLVLTSVGEVGDYGGYTPGGGGFTGGKDDEELHETVIDVAGGGGLEDKY